MHFLPKRWCAIEAIFDGEAEKITGSVLFILRRILGDDLAM